MKNKIVFIGSSGVGKTSLLFQFIEDEFIKIDEDVGSTIGVSYISYKIKSLENDKIIETELQIWDTAGQERYRSLVPFYLRGCKIIILVYDISAPDIEEIIYWLRYGETCEKCTIYLVGNKMDLIEENKSIENKNKIGSKLRVKYHVIVSAKKRIGIEEMKKDILEIIKKYTEKESDENEENMILKPINMSKSYWNYIC